MINIGKNFNAIILSLIFFSVSSSYADNYSYDETSEENAPLSICQETTTSQENEAFSGTYLNLSVTEVKELDQDLLTAVLRYEIEAENSKEAQNMVNQTMKKALEVTSRYAEIESSTDQYYIYK